MDEQKDDKVTTKAFSIKIQSPGTKFELCVPDPFYKLLTWEVQRRWVADDKVAPEIEISVTVESNWVQRGVVKISMTDGNHTETLPWHYEAKEFSGSISFPAAGFYPYAPFHVQITHCGEVEAIYTKGF